MLKKVIATRDGGYLLAGTATIEAPSNKTNSKTSNAVNKAFDFGGENEQAAALKKEGSDAINKEADKLNSGIKKEMDKANKALGLSEKSPIKLNTDALQFINPITEGNGNNNNNTSKNNSNNLPVSRSVPPSGARGLPLGSTDFWVVKLKDNSKPEKIKAVIEAVPNPATTFTNIIIGYDYKNGTASVFDLAGHQLASFAISSRTVPVDLSQYPEGIYIVNITTNVGNDSVKVIKTESKN